VKAWFVSRRFVKTGVHTDASPAMVLVVTVELQQ
jgi:hypothetical protein